jgi:hypothetical protein
MIFRVSIGELAALLDDEMVERPTAEVSRDYLKACSDQVLALYEALPDGVIADPESDG